ncbi:MAG TPA: hypothetical protein VLB81_00585 [Gaiellales bacterium]|nr:hypothetical protein [Gaiellales bacterium]
MRTVRTLIFSAAASAALVILPPAATAGQRDHGNGGHDGVVVWTSRAAPGSEHLMIARPDGGDARPLTAPSPDVVDLNAQVSPDGEWIAYERSYPESTEVRLVRPDGSDDHPLDAPCIDPCVALALPTWLSADRLAYSAISGPFTEWAASVVLWTIRTDGTQLRRLSPAGSEGVFEDEGARLSADGSFLVLRRVRISDGTSALFRLDGRGLHRLTPWELRAEIYDLSTAAHGPTADLVVFESYARGTAEDSFVDLATVPADCRGPRDCARAIVWLTDNGSTGRRNANPQWSPDGRSLVFTDRSSFTEPNAEIWTMRYGGHHRQQVSTYPGFDYRPAWGVD